MARNALTKTTAAGAYAGAGAAVTMEAADTSDKNQFTAGGNDLIIAHNTGSGSHNVTISSADDPYGREEDITEAVAAGVITVFGPIKLPGWIQSDGNIYLEADDAEVYFGVVTLPG